MAKRGPKPLELTPANALTKLQARSKRTVKPTGLKQACLEWTGGKTSAGYGQVGMASKVFYAHHLSVYVRTGHLPRRPAAVIHKCDNPPCWEYDHLVVATQAVNVADMDAKGRARRDGQSKLTKAQVLAIRSIQGLTNGAIAQMFGVSRRTIGDVRSRKYYRDV